MAQKKITDLTLRSDFDETVNLPGDDTSQTWRVTGQQILDFIQASVPTTTVQKKLSGSGTYTPTSGTQWIEVLMVGAGGGGGGSGTSGSSGETAGSSTTFGSSLLTAGGGGVGGWGAVGGSGGSITVNSPAVDLASIAGGKGGEPPKHGDTAFGAGGGTGGVARYFAQGGTMAYQTDGIAGPANTGGGGSGAGAHSENLNIGGSGGGSGGFIHAIIGKDDLAGSYAYAVGAGGTGGTGSGGTTHNGGAGASGCIIIIEHYV